jgi:hypothetical protein
MMITPPPGTYICSNGLYWNKTQLDREANTALYLEFISTLWNAPIEKVYIDNPVGAALNHS